jgi:MFS transporter, NNP family, nitrate/nitrite transporter
MSAQPTNTRPLVLGTLSFAVCFVAWEPISAFAPRLREMFSLSATQTALLVAVPAWLVPAAGSYQMLLVVAFFLGIAGSSFPVGVGFVSRWTPAERQGAALGGYGLGNIGQSAAVFLGPLPAARIGWQPVFKGAAVISGVLLLACFGLYQFVRGVDREVRRR